MTPSAPHAEARSRLSGDLVINPLPSIVVFLIAGIASRYLMATTISAFPLLLLAAVCLGAMVVFPRARLPLFLLCLFLTGYLRMDSVLPGGENPRLCRGTWEVSDFPRPLPSFGQSFSVRAVSGHCRRLSAPLRARLYDYRHIAPGMRFSATLKLYPGRTKYYTTLTGQTRWLTEPGSLLARWRSHLSERIHLHFSAEDERWLQALLIANRAQLQQRDHLMLQKSATSHLLAISGLHLALIIAMGFFLVQFLWASCPALALRCEPRSAALVVGLSIGALYTVLTGAHIPVVRAWLMFATLTAAWFSPAIQGRYTGLLLAALVIVVIDPSAVLSPGAWLSFLATAGVLDIWPYLRTRSAPMQWLGVQAYLSLLLLPLLWALFGGISPGGFFINLVVIPWLAPLLLLSLLALVFPIFAPWVDWALAAYLQVIRQGAQWSYTYFSPHWQPTIACALFVSLALLVRKRKIVVPSLIAAAGAAALPFLGGALYQAPTRKPAYVLFTPGRTIVVNSGYRKRNQDDAKRYLLPALRHRGRVPDAIVLTGSSPYQTSGLITLLTAYPGTPVYTLLPMPELPFATQYCPQQAIDGLRFLRDRHCQAHIAQRWKITPEGVSTSAPGVL